MQVGYTASLQCFGYLECIWIIASLEVMLHHYRVINICHNAGINLRCAFAPFAHKTTLGRRKNRRRSRFGVSSFGAALWYFMSAPRFFGRPLYRSARLL